MENVGGSEKRSIISDPNFNFFAMSDGQREGSLAYSDISFPSHVSELESFQSELDISLNSHDSTSTAGHKLPESGIGFESSTQNNLEGDDREKERDQSENGGKSLLPELPEQTSENIDLLLAALKAATIQDSENGSDKGTSENNKSETSSQSSNRDSSKFISKESFPESVLGETSESWGKDISLNPEELVHQPSSTPFCGQNSVTAVKPDLESRLSEKFFAPSATPDDHNNYEPQTCASNPWSFSGNSILLQTTVPGGNTPNQAEGEQPYEPNTDIKTKKDQPIHTPTIQKKLWSDSSHHLSTTSDTFQDKNRASGGFESETKSERIFNPFEDSDNGDFTLALSTVEGGQNVVEDDEFSFNQEVEDEFSFQSGGDAAQRLDQDEEQFKADHAFDKEDAMVAGDTTMFSDYVLPDGSSRSGRRSLQVIGINDPNDKGEVRVSFGDFFGAKTEELGRLGDGDGGENRPRPQFSATSVKVSPAAAIPRPLYRPSSPEGFDEVTLSQQSLINTQPTEPQQEKAVLDSKFQEQERPSTDVSRRFSPYGAEEKDKEQKEKEKEKAQKKKKRPDRGEKQCRSSDSLKASQHFQDPNNSAVAALKFCHSSQGSKILGMSPSELKSLSTALAKVTQGDSREIYKVLVNFIYRERRLSQTATDLGETSQRLTDVFYPEESKGSIESTIGGAEPGSPDETDGLTFYHSDTNSDVSPRGSKLETVLSSAPSPPLDSSSPKSTGSSIAVQTELLDNCVGEALSISSHAATTSKVSGSSSKAGVSTISTNTGQYRPIIHTQQPPEGSTNVALQTCASSTGIPTGITTGIQDDLTATSNQTGVAVVGIPGTVVMTSIQSSLAAMGGRTYVAPPPSMSNASSSIEFTSSPLLCDRLVAVQPTSKSGTTSGDLGVFHNRPVFENKALQPHPRSAFRAQGFFSSQTQGVGMGREAQGTDVIGMYHGEQGAQLNMGNDRGVGDMRPVGQRQDKVWNWRTERSLEIQMVIPPVLDFPGVLCVGTSAEALLPIHNPTSRWIRCSSTIISCSVNGLKVDRQSDCPFSVRETTLVGPKLTENVKVEFESLVAGIYIADMKVVSTPVGSITSDSETSSAIVNVQGFSEQPKLEVLADKGLTLDFGELHHGCNRERPLRILNRGRTSIPLKMLICSSSSPGIFVFSKNNSSDSIQNLQIHSTTLKCLLPATNEVGIQPQPLTIWIEMVGKSHRHFEKSDQAEIYTAGINIQLDTGTVAKILGNISLKGIIGFTKIQIPKAFQMAMCLSSPVGQKVTRQMPFSNAGNICANVELTIPKHSDVFVVSPNKFLVRPGTAVMVEVGFSPRVKDSYESVIQVSELSDGKCYEVLLRGSSVEPQSGMEEGPPILSNKSWLCWTGVDIGKAAHQRLFLLNDSSEHSIYFQAVILGNHADFEVQRMKSDFTRGENSSEQMLLRPKERIPVYVLFAPSSLGVFKSALVLKPDRGPRFQIPLYAYGGTSELSICDTNKTSDGYVANLGQVSLGHRNILKVSLKNSGSRAAFVKAVCYSDFHIRLLYPQTHLSIVPSEFILPERTSKELVIVYQPLQHDAKACQSQVKRVATVVFYYGDEVLRQWYKRNLEMQRDVDSRRSTGNSRLDDLRFDKVFQDENCVAEEFDYPDVENWDQVFDSHLSQVLLNLLGGPEKTALTPTVKDGESAFVMATPRQRHVREPQPSMRNQTPAQKEKVVKENALQGNAIDENQDKDKTAAWSLIPEQLSLKVPVRGSMDSTKKVQLLNYSERPLEFEFIWPAHCIAVTPHIGTIPPKNQTLVHISVWASISSSGIELPWRGTAYVNCDGTKKALAIQIHKHLVSDGSPAPTVINKPLTKIDPDKDVSLLYQTYPKMPKLSSPLKITPVMVEFAEVEVGKASASTVTLENVSTSSVRWRLSSVAPAYAKVSGTSSELLRTTYPVFRFSSHGGLMRPSETVTVEVEFRTRDAGVYCQIWDVQTNPESPLTSTKIQIELSGKAVPQKASSSVLAEKKRKDRVSDPECIKEPTATSSVPVYEMPSKQTTEGVKGNTNLYFEPNNVQFPDTEVGKTSTAKIKICNRSSDGQQFRVVVPQAPFSVKYTSIFVKPTHYLKIPVYFSPQEPSTQYKEIVVFANSNSGELLSVILQGKSILGK